MVKRGGAFGRALRGSYRSIPGAHRRRLRAPRRSANRFLLPLMCLMLFSLALPSPALAGGVPGGRNGNRADIPPANLKLPTYAQVPLPKPLPLSARTPVLPRKPNTAPPNKPLAGLNRRVRNFILSGRMSHLVAATGQAMQTLDDGETVEQDPAMSTADTTAYTIDDSTHVLVTTVQPQNYKDDAAGRRWRLAEQRRSDVGAVPELAWARLACSFHDTQRHHPSPARGT
jgi:hypothetical protein